MPFCERCREYIHNDVCHCEKYYVTFEGEEHDIYSGTHWGAAVSYAKQYNENGDYYLMNETETIEVKSMNGIVKKFNISAEPDIHYSAEEVE